jgi:hypothetical protein
MERQYSRPEIEQMITVTPNLRSIVDHDGAVILDIPHNAMSTLNPTGAYIWERLQRGVPITEIVSELSRDTGTDEAVVASDVEGFMNQLKSKQLIAIV